MKNNTFHIGGISNPTTVTGKILPLIKEGLHETSKEGQENPCKK